MFRVSVKLEMTLLVGERPQEVQLVFHICLALVGEAPSEEPTGKDGVVSWIGVKVSFVVQYWERPGAELLIENSERQPRTRSKAWILSSK